VPEGKHTAIFKDRGAVTGLIDARFRFEYCADMAKKKGSRKDEKKAFTGSFDRLGGKKLVQHGAEESSRVKESHQHSVGGPRKGR